jgi:3-deoxy-D-manno-octulosonic-acid transferase
MTMISRSFYNLLLLLIAPFFIFGLYKNKNNTPAFGSRWKEHFGFSPAIADNSQIRVWFHTVSVGEVLATTALIKAYKLRHPEHTIIITTTTSTGAEQAEKLKNIAIHRYMPLDFPFAVRRFIKTLQPHKLYIMETELWPNTLYIAQQANISISVINARLSNRSFKRYQKLPFIFNLLLKPIDQVLCQTIEDASRFKKLGLQEDKVKVTGSIKFDIHISKTVKQAGVELRNTISKTRPVWIVASTHQGEDEIILSAHQQLLKKHTNLLLILVPRHPDRFETIYQLCQANKMKTIKRTLSKTIPQNTQVYLADTMGEMLTLIAASDICFMAGSLIGDKVGGHNLLEPAALAKPCLTGPSFYNFKQITEQLIDAQGCEVCQSSEDIANKVKLLLNDTDKFDRMGRQALSIVNRNKGALQKTMGYLK